MDYYKGDKAVVKNRTNKLKSQTALIRLQTKEDRARLQREATLRQRTKASHKVPKRLRA